MATYEQIVKKYRNKQLRWTKTAVQRLDRILNKSARDILKKLNSIAGTGKIEEHYLSDLLADVMRILDTLKVDYASLMNINILGSAQIAADREKAIIGKLFSIEDMQNMTAGLHANKTQEVYINSIGHVSVSFGQVSENALNAVFRRVYSDGLTLSDRLWKLDAQTRRDIGDKIISGIARGQSARDLGRELKQYLTEQGTGNGRYNAMRLARSEINTAHREGHIQSCYDSNGQLKNYIHGIGWRLSGSHPKPDICDIWASQDIDGLGPGNYKPENVPVDHPHGLCYTCTILKEHQDLQFVTQEAKPDEVSQSQLDYYGIQ